MKFQNVNLTLSLLGILFLTIFTSCNNGDYLQEYQNYYQFNKINNARLTGWFPSKLIKSDASNIKNVSYLSTKCVFGVFDYKNEELYDSIFNKGKYIDSTNIKVFQTQFQLVKNITPEWFPKVEYWNNKYKGIILLNNFYVYNDSKKKQIYYFQPKDESTFID